MKTAEVERKNNPLPFIERYYYYKQFNKRTKNYLIQQNPVNYCNTNNIIFLLFIIYRKKLLNLIQKKLPF